MSEDKPNWRALLWLRRYRVRGRRWFIWHIGVLRFALPIALLATALRAATEPFHAAHFLLHFLANALAGLLGGYVAGRLIWRLLIEQ